MKKLFLIIISILFSRIGYSQIISIEEVKEIVTDNNKVLPRGTTYIKDTNNKLDKFVGTWKGEINNKKYEIRTEKATIEAAGLGYKEDVLTMRYRISNEFDTIIENTLDIPDNSPYTIEGYYLNNDNSYVLTYVGKKGKCGQGGSMFINLRSDGTMRLKLVPGHQIITPQNCPSGTAEQIFPTKDGGVILTRA